MTRTMTAAFAGLALAAGAAAGLAAPAAAQPRLEQTGDGYSVLYGAADRGDAAGGRDGRLVGGGDDAVVLYSGPDTARGGRSAALSGGGDNATISYGEMAPATGMASGPATRGAGRRG